MYASKRSFGSETPRFHDAPLRTSHQSSHRNPLTMRSPSVQLIQPENWAQPNMPTYNTPIFLIHDGGGTTLSYKFLEILGRYTYGIRNPYYYSGQVFEGGISEMAFLYASWIRKTVQDKDFPAKKRNMDGSTSIFLGGWSLGGLLSMEIARQLAVDDVVRVAGILMIDSVCPGGSRPSPARSMPVVPSFGVPIANRFSGVRFPTAREAMCDDDVSSDDESLPDDALSDASSRDSSSEDESLTEEDEIIMNKIRSRKCMTEAVRMVRQWRLPQWSGRLYDRRPKVVLLRARNYVPAKEGRTVGMDLNREDPLLGWGDYDEEMISDVYDVDGHHFNLFEYEKISNMTRTIKKGLDRLEEASQMMMFGEGW
ncbi:Alpha/Beta hydrolase protein [Trichoderma evansii]